MINSVVLVGRLTKDPEMRYTQTGKAVTRFTLAVYRMAGRDEAGNREADFIDVVAWEKTAELCGQYLGKGALAGVQGRIQVRKWTTQDGQPRKSFEVKADRVSFLESRAERERREAGRGYAPPPAPGGAPSDAPTDDEPPEPMDAEDPFGDQ